MTTLILCILTKVNLSIYSHYDTHIHKKSIKKSQSCVSWEDIITIRLKDTRYLSYL